ncbi:protein involved in carbohydrate transport, partial [Arthrobacter sp. Hiyo6]
MVDFRFGGGRLNVLIDGVKKASPGLSVDNAAVSGGGGSNARQA